MWFRNQNYRKQLERRLKLEPLETRTAMAGDLLSSMAIGTTAGGESLTNVVAQNGNRYVALDYSLNGSIDVDPLHAYADSRDIFAPAPSTLESADATLIAKFDSQGMLQWKTQVNGVVKSLAVDGLGDVYVSGFVVGTNVMFGTTGITTAPNNADIFLAKLGGSDGGWALATRITNTSQLNEVNSNLVVAPDGKTIYVSSSWSSNGYNSSITKIAINSNVASTVWTDVWAGSNISVVDMELQPNSQLVVGGTHRGQSDFDPSQATLNLLSGPNKNSLNSAGFVLLLNSTGTLAWAKNFRVGSTGGSTVASVVVDASGIAVSGSFSGVVDFDPNAPIVNLLNRGGADVYFAKLNANGSLLNAASYGSSLEENSAKLVANPSGGYLLTSQTYDPTSSKRFSEIRSLNQTGSVVWTTKAESALISGVTVDPLNNEIVIVGGFWSDLYYTDTNGVRTLQLRPLSVQGQSSAYLLRIRL